MVKNRKTIFIFVQCVYPNICTGKWNTLALSNGFIWHSMLLQWICLMTMRYMGNEKKH